MIANEWDAEQVTDWGLDVSYLDEQLPLNEIDETNVFNEVIVIGVNNIQDIDKLTDFYSLESFTMTAEWRKKLSKTVKIYVFKP